jgi:glycolate oxidase
MTDLGKLEAALPAGALITNPAGMEPYRRDWAGQDNAGMPLAVVLATSTHDVQEVLRWASSERVPVVPRGAGTGVSGGATAVDGGIVLSLERMTAITIEPSMRVAVAQPGAMNADVKRAAAEHCLWYPPDPSSYEICSIGGNVATNAGGLCCVKYGVTTDYVLGMTVVLADGTAVTLGGPRLKDVAGYSLTKLFVGSEGTLGVITEVTLRLLPAQVPSATLVAAFASVEQAAEAVLAIVARIRPSMLEFMDHTSINAVEDLLGMGLDRTAQALLIARTDSGGAAGREEIAVIEAACLSCGSYDVFATDDQVAGEAFAAARRLAFEAIGRTGDILFEDVGVPLPALPALVHGIESISAARAVTIAVVAHAGDGNTHPMIVFDPADGDASVRAQRAFGEVMELAISLGGTITGEHGVGRLKAPWLSAYLGPDVMTLNRQIKQALDPAGILNPGAKLI